MKGLERALEILRPFVDARDWDYCVVWKLGDDSSRLIEWMGCCCSGGSNGSCEEKNRNQSVPLCRDLYFAHKINSKACQALAAFPSFLPLCSEIYGDVVSSNQSNWIINSAPLDSNDESIGTRVLIPVLGGLIELFSAKHIAKDQKIIDFIVAHCNVPKQEGTVDHFYSSLDPFVEQNLHNLPAQSYLLGLLCGTDMVHPLNRCSTHSSLQGSSGSLDPSNDYQSLVSHCDYFSHSGISNLSLQKPPDLKKSKSDKSFQKNPGYQVLSKGIHKPEFRSKNLITERNRRHRINDGIFTLRSLVPKITKMNKVATLGDAINYIRELESEFKDLQEELTELEKEQEQECKNSNTELKTSDEKNSPSEINQGSTSVCQKKRIENKTEVNQLGKREFLIKVFSEKEKGGFRRLIDLVYSMGLQVANVNMTTCNGLVSTFLTVEAISKDVQLKRLRESLLKLGG